MSEQEQAYQKACMACVMAMRILGPHDIKRIFEAALPLRKMYDELSEQEQAYQEACMACVMAMRIIGPHDIAGILRAIERADAIGPLIDPTLWLNKSKAMGEDRRIFEAALPLRKMFDEILAWSDKNEMEPNAMSDPTMKITLSFGQRRILLMLADRGRRVSMYMTAEAINRHAGNPDSKVGQLAVDSIYAMEKMGLIRITPLVGSDQSELELLDFGAQIVAQMKRRFKDEVAQARKDGSEG